MTGGAFADLIPKGAASTAQSLLPSLIQKVQHRMKSL